MPKPCFMKPRIWKSSSQDIYCQIKKHIYILLIGTSIWFEDSLSNWKESVLVNGKESLWADCHSKAPQGLVLESISLTLYINDIVTDLND